VAVEAGGNREGRDMISVLALRLAEKKTRKKVFLALRGKEKIANHSLSPAIYCQGGKK